MIGHCSGGRQAFLAAISLPLDAAVDCYGGFVVGTPPEGHPLHGVPPLVDRTGDLSCPLLGLFGRDDVAPSPEQVAELEAGAQGARQDLRVPLLRRRWARLHAGGPAQLPARGRRGRLAAHLGLLRPLPVIVRAWEGVAMCTYLTEKVSISGSGKGPSGWFRLTDASVYFDHPVHAQAEHTLNIDFLDPGAGPRRGSRSSSPRNRLGPWPRRSSPPWIPHLPGSVSRGDDPPRPPRSWGDPSPQTPLGGTHPPGPPLGTPGMSVPRATMHVGPPREGGTRGMEAAGNAVHRRAGRAG